MIFPEPGSIAAIAVSGGADSMALLLMAQQWAAAQDGRVVALTVDHRLREASAGEAEQVKRWCEARNIPHHTLRWNTPTPNQADARDARYRLLTDWCKAHDITTLLTAHHMGDQAETLFFRLARGSNLRGLACMPEVSNMHGLQLIRPLLGHSKNELMEYLRARGQAWIEDPSNRNMDYTRNAIRAQLRSLPNADEIEARAAAVAQAFGRIRAVLDKKTDTAFNDVVTVNGTTACIRASGYRALPPEIALLVIAQLIQRLTGGDHPPRTEKLERLCRWLASPGMRSATLAHLVFTHDAKAGHFTVKAEY